MTKSSGNCGFAVIAVVTLAEEIPNLKLNFLCSGFFFFFDILLCDLKLNKLLEIISKI